MIDVNVGDSVTVVLHNSLPQASSILFQGQPMPPDTTGAPATTGVKTYSFTATNPGTFLYEAGFATGNNTQHQVAMGLYGAFVVRPALAGSVVWHGGDELQHRGHPRVG